jgi:hypothetical protein
LKGATRREKEVEWAKKRTERGGEKTNKQITFEGRDIARGEETRSGRRCVAYTCVEVAGGRWAAGGGWRGQYKARGGAVQGAMAMGEKGGKSGEKGEKAES